MKKLVLKPSTLSTAGRSYKIDYASELNPAQYEAVMHTHGPALILAGAGTGKTRTLVYRVARLVEDGIDPSSILLLTFTRKSAREMLRRAGALLDGRCDRVSGGTFHSVAYLLMQRFGKKVGVMDQADAEDVMNYVRSKFDVGKSKRRFPQKGTLLDMCSTAINTTTPLADVIATKYSQFIAETDLIAEIIRSYQAYKVQNNTVDYDDLLLHFLALTREEETSAILKKQFKFLMVDEYQDTNALQHSIIMGLSGANGNVVAVGDDAQSIYAFRGADVRNIHAFPSSFDSCKIVRLEHNYRSTQPILDVCNRVLYNAPNMFDKQLFSEKKTGEQPMLIACSNERQQSNFIVQQVLELRENGTPLSEISVLMRSGFLSFDLEIELGKANIPFRKFGGLKFAEAAHVKDVIAMLKLTTNPRDAISWLRVLILLQGVGRKMAQMFVEQMPQMADAFTSPITGINSKAQQTIDVFRSILNGAAGLQNAHERVIELTSAYKPILEATYDDHQKRWRDIETLVAICARYTSTEQFLADIALEPPSETIVDIEEDDGEEEFLTLSTIHSAKGLEWNSVFVIWVNEGRIPSARSAESEESLEEERRLLYVACTRAKERLMLTYPTIMFEWEHSDVLGQPSRFLDAVEQEQCQRYYLSEESVTDDPELN